MGSRWLWVRGDVGSIISLEAAHPSFCIMHFSLWNIIKQCDEYVIFSIHNFMLSELKCVHIWYTVQQK